jgi:hypothetical protein
MIVVVRVISYLSLILVLGIGITYGSELKGDEFDSQTLNNAWIFASPDKDGKWSLTDKPGWLSIKCPAGDHDMWDFRGGAPMMAIKAPGDDYIIETHLKISEWPANSYAGIHFLGKDALNDEKSPGPWGHFILCCGTPGSDIRWQNSVTVEGPKVGLSGQEIYMKIEKKGNDFDSFYKFKEDETWQSVGKGSVDMGKEHYICLGTCNWGGTGTVTVEFDYFRSNPSIIMAVASPASKLATTWGGIKVQ